MKLVLGFTDSGKEIRVSLDNHDLKVFSKEDHLQAQTVFLDHKKRAEEKGLHAQANVFHEKALRHKHLAEE